MPNFSRTTLGKFEDASASIPLRNIARAFDRSNITPGDDPGGAVGDRRIYFRRCVAGVDQSVPQQLDRLGDAFGTLLEEVAASKVDFLVNAAQSDGFVFANGVFRAAETSASPFTITRVADLTFIDDCGKRLHLLANDRPADALGGAKELIDTLCRAVLRTLGEPLPKETADLGAVAETTLDALRPASTIIGVEDGDALVRRCYRQLGDCAAILGEVRVADGSLRARERKTQCLSPRYARLAVGAAVALARFVAETHLERAASETVGARKPRGNR